jgi:hypothetical protein
MPLSQRPLEGVFLGSCAVAEGWITRRQLESGLYRRLLRNVYADPAIPVDHELLARAAAMIMPTDAALGSRSAAWWWGGRTAGAHDPVVVVGPTSSGWRGPKGIRVHRCDLQSQDLQTLEDGVRVTTVERTVRDVAILEPVKDAVACLDAMAASGTLTEAMSARIERSMRGRWGFRRLKKVLPVVDGRAQSPPESWVRVACHFAGLPAPVPQYRVVERGVFLGTVDLAWPEARLVVEYEGAYHFDGVQIVKDDHRYAGMLAAGWRVIRLGSADLRDLDAAVERISGVLQAAAS